jgi:hypothetical protein
MNTAKGGMSEVAPLATFSNLNANEDMNLDMNNIEDLISKFYQRDPLISN